MLGKEGNIIGKGFAECSPLQRSVGNAVIGKDVFAESRNPSSLHN